jgi:hypothetical protein
MMALLPFRITILDPRGRLENAMIRIASGKMSKGFCEALKQAASTRSVKRRLIHFVA